MRRLLIVATAAAVATATIALISAPSGAQVPGERTFTLIEKNSEGKFSFVDNPPRAKGHGSNPRVSGGDEFVVAQVLRDPSGKRAGGLKIHCTFVRGNSSFNKAPTLCEAVYNLADGDISVQVGGHLTRVFRGAVTGGTEAYEGSRGSVTITMGPKQNTDVVHLLP
jgi:hypothetical protein